MSTTTGVSTVVDLESDGELIRTLDTAMHALHHARSETGAGDVLRCLPAVFFHLHNRTPR